MDSPAAGVFCKKNSTEKLAREFAVFCAIWFQFFPRRVLPLRHPLPALGLKCPPLLILGRGAMANGDGMNAPARDQYQFDPEQAAYWHAIISDLDEAVIRYSPDLVCKWCNAN